MRRALLTAGAIMGLTAVALAAVIYPNYREDLHAAQARVAGKSEVAATVCGPIEFARAGAGPPVLVLHGSGGGFDQALALAEGLVSNGFQAIAVSRFGYLRTPLPADASAAAQADANVCLLNALGIQSVAVLGASAGAPSSLQMAIRYPERVSALILLVPATYLPDTAGAGTRVPAGLDLIFNTALKSDVPFWLARQLVRDTLMERMVATPPALLEKVGSHERERAYRMLDNVLPVSARRLGLLNDARITSSLPRFELERITAPTLVISAQDDLFGTFERGRYTAREIPNARFVGFPSGGHMLVGRQAEVTAEMLALLTQNNRRSLRN
jgi:pimeloyl-ACP methyl ester carboxylesterase